MEKKPKFTTRKGEMNGVYLVTDWVKRGIAYEVTLKCTVCGHEVTRMDSTFRIIADFQSGKCFCDYWKASEGKGRTGLRERTDEQSEYKRLRHNFKLVLKRKLKANPNLPHDDFDTIWKAVGPMPPETDLYSWELGIKGRGHGKPDMTADNYEWRRLLKTKAVNQAHADSNKGRRHLMRVLRQRETLADVSNEDLMRERLKAFGEEWKHFVGKTFGRFKVVDFRKEYTSASRVNYFFTARCKCGHQFERAAHLFYKGNVRCPSCQRYIKNSISLAKNSSTQRDSKLMRLRMMKDARARIKGNKGIDIDSLMMLRESHSWYSLCFGTEDTMNFFIDCDLAGKGDEIRQIYWRG